MADSDRDALQRIQVLNQFMNQITPQLQQLGVDRSGYKGYAQAYQSAINNNLAVPQDFADIMYEYGGFGNTGKQLFEPRKDGNPKLTEAGKAYASRNLPEGVALHEGFFDFGKQVSDLAKSKGDNTRYKTLSQQINAAAGYGMEIPQHIQDLSYALGLGNTPVAKTQNVTNTQQNASTQLNSSANVPGAPGNLSGLQTVPTNLSFIKPQSLTPNSVPYAPSAAPATPIGSDDYVDAEKVEKIQAALGSDVSKYDINNFGKQLNSLEELQGALKDIRGIGQSENKYDIGNFDKLLNRLEEQENNTSSDAGQKEAAPASAKYAANEGAANKESSNAPEFLAQFKKQLEEQAASDTPATKVGTYAEVTGDTSTKGGRDRSSEGSRPRGPGAFGVGPREMSPEYKDKVSRFKDRISRQMSAARRARDRGLSDYRSRRSSSRRGTEFGPGRARRDTSGSF